jgi:DNA polymerase III delta prime subunit
MAENRLTHSILLYGGDLDSEYTLALEIARLLNCTGDKSDNCQCLNCKWIREHKHPSVLTISRLDNKPDDDKTETVISVKQAELIRNSLITASDYHRVFIFCDKDDDGNIKGLNSSNFQEATANSLLKSIEEPPERVTFIFLTRNTTDLISTIVSRSQVFFVPNRNREIYDYDLISPVLKNYWEIPRGEAFNVSEKLVELSQGHDPLEMLEQIQNYMLVTLKSNPKQRFLIDNLNSAELAKNEIIKGMKPETVFDELCLNIIK